MIPPDFRKTHLADPFEIHLGPIYETGEGAARRYGLKVDARHVNRRDVMHGGMLMTFADATLGQLAMDISEGALCVTLNMQAQFLAPVPLGGFIEVLPELTRRTRAMLFIRGDYRVAGQTVMTAASIWKLIGQR
ncbi:MAG TPA: PaaI family thioesterase [Rhizomicrobium sp.]|nr:PaaI family thioesterase [Rhizomicrobium sp.]